MRITNSVTTSPSQNNLTMVDENSPSDHYSVESNIDHDENDCNVGINDSNTTIEDSNNINSTSTNINLNTITTQSLIQLNFLGKYL